MNDDFDDLYDEDEGVLIPQEVMYKVRQAFQMLEEADILEHDDPDTVLLRVARTDYEEFYSPSGLFVLH